MANGIVGPTTYDEIRWAAIVYRGRYNDERYAEMCSVDLRQKLMVPEDASVDKLMRWVNHLGSRFDYANTPLIKAALGKIVPSIEPLAASTLESVVLPPVAEQCISRAFDGLVTVSTPTVAAKILAVLNPSLFVMWDGAISWGYFPNERLTGATYAKFIAVMRQSVLSIKNDPCRPRSVSDIATYLSRELSLPTTFPLAKFIDEYNWLTLARELIYPKALIGKEHHA